MGILDTTDTEFGAIMSNVSHRMPQSQQFEIVDCTYTECTVLQHAATVHSRCLPAGAQALPLTGGVHAARAG